MLLLCLDFILPWGPYSFLHRIVSGSLFMGRGGTTHRGEITPYFYEVLFKAVVGLTFKHMTQQISVWRTQRKEIQRREAWLVMIELISK
jgi:hypothetical protein